MADIVGERPLGTSLVVDLWLPLHISGGIELADLELRGGVSAEGAYGPIHDVTRNSLDTVDEIDVSFLIQGTVIDVVIADVRVVHALNDVGNIVRIIHQGPVDQHVRVGRDVTWFGHVDPAWAIVVVPLAPR